MAHFQVFSMCNPLVLVDAPDEQSARNIGAQCFGYPDERTMTWETEQPSWLHAELVVTPEPEPQRVSEYERPRG